MAKSRDKKVLIFDWFSYHDSNLWRLLGFSIVSAMGFACVYYTLNLENHHSSNESVEPQALVSVEIDKAPDRGYFSKVLGKDYFLAPDPQGNMFLNPKSYELPFAQYQKLDMPELAQLQESSTRVIAPGLLVPSAPVIPNGTSAISHSIVANSSAQVRWVPKVKFQMSKNLESRFIGEFPQEIAAKILGAQPYFKILIGVDTEGNLFFQLPVSQLENSLVGSEMTELMASLRFSKLAISGQSTKNQKTQGLLWGELMMSWSEDAL